MPFKSALLWLYAFRKSLFVTVAVPALARGFRLNVWSGGTTAVPMQSSDCPKPRLQGHRGHPWETAKEREGERKTEIDRKQMLEIEETFHSNLHGYCVYKKVQLDFWKLSFEERYYWRNKRMLCKSATNHVNFSITGPNFFTYSRSFLVFTEFIKSKALCLYFWTFQLFCGHVLHI